VGFSQSSFGGLGATVGEQAHLGLQFGRIDPTAIADLLVFPDRPVRKDLAMTNPTIATVVFPARDFTHSVAAWSTVFGTGPAFSSDGIEKAAGEADFAVFKTAEIEIGLTSKPWVNEPLVLLNTNDIEASRQELIAAGATPLAETTDGSLAVLGTAPVANGDPSTGIVDVPGFRLAAVELADGSKLGLRQAVEIAA
jgi:hypothetical protein